MATDGLQSQYSVLAELKQIDDKAYRIRIDIDRIPQEIDKLASQLSGKKTELEAARLALDTCEKKLRSSELELREKEDKLKKAEGKMMEVKTNEEYQAAMKENQTQKDAKGSLEERVLNLLNEVEAQRAVFKKLEAEFKEDEAKVRSQQKVLEDECDKLKSSFDQAVQTRKTRAVELGPDIRDLYEKVCANSPSGTIVYVDAGMCRGCNMKIRPQIYNEILGYRAVHRCGSCGRIMIISSRETEKRAEANAE